MKGATLVDLDSSGRLNVPAALLEHAGIDLSKGNEVIVSGLGEKVEIWTVDAYQAQVLSDTDDFDFGDLAEDVRKDIDPNLLT
tara:strand:- start:51 stop:299 length:249 start_codon:yes stop_codon:yes gene_type:complete